MRCVNRVLCVYVFTMLAFVWPRATHSSLPPLLGRRLAFVASKHTYLTLPSPIPRRAMLQSSRGRQLSQPGLHLHGHCQQRSAFPLALSAAFSTTSPSASSAHSTPARSQDGPKEYTLFADGHQFASLGFHPAVAAAMEKLGRPNATVIQARAFEHIRAGKDVVLGAETGSGKTMAYVLPLVDALLQPAKRPTPVAYPSVIVLVPNRDLSEQVLRMITEVLEQLPADTKRITALTMYGAADNWPYHAGKPAPDFLIVTPAFLATLAHDKQTEDVFSNVRVLVMDEADMLLDGSYLKQMEAILNAFRRMDRLHDNPTKGLKGNGTTQYILSAATLPSYGLKSVEEYVKRRFPEVVRVLTEHVHLQHPIVDQQWHEWNSTVLAHRIPAIADAILQHKDSEGQVVPTMVFANTANDARLVAEQLTSTAGIECGEFHKSVDVVSREENMKRFRSGDLRVLVCTDLAARGLDIPQVKHVVQAQFALNVVQHLHRIGRASRGGSKGFATNFFDTTSDELLKKVRESEHVEQAFSRRRGLRQKAKKLSKRASSEDETQEN